VMSRMALPSFLGLIGANRVHDRCCAGGLGRY
jgi:hypothetical protein